MKIVTDSLQSNFQMARPFPRQERKSTVVTFQCQIFSGPINIIASQALQLAELQRKLQVDAERRDKEAQEMKQRLRETEGRLKETEGRMKATERHIKWHQRNWRKTALTLDSFKSRRQHGKGSGGFQDQDVTIVLLKNERYENCCCKAPCE
jgi:hypothetical protein